MISDDKSTNGIFFKHIRLIQFAFDRNSLTSGRSLMAEFILEVSFSSMVFNFKALSPIALPATPVTRQTVALLLNQKY